MFVQLKERHCLIQLALEFASRLLGGQSVYPCGGNIENTTYTVDIGDTETFTVLGSGYR